VLTAKSIPVNSALRLCHAGRGGAAFPAFPALRGPCREGIPSLLLIDDARPLLGCLRCVCFADWGIVCLQSSVLRDQHHVFVNGNFFLPAGPASLHRASYLLPACSPRRAAVMSSLCSAARKLRHAARAGRCEWWMIASDALATVLAGVLRPASDAARLLSACCPSRDVQLQSWGGVVRGRHETADVHLLLTLATAMLYLNSSLRLSFPSATNILRINTLQASNTILFLIIALHPYTLISP
jgi:hypothetical protein